MQQTREEGLILVDVKIGKQAGNLVLLHKRGQQAEGRFDPTYGSFMGSAATVTVTNNRAQPALRKVATRPTSAPPRWI
ncbi:MAG: hypothetical protein WCB57_10790 [Pseudonocardiaceae bacterium]